MKKNAIGNGSSQCVLCADEFGLLGASPLLCNDCKKAVCTKCSVDTVNAHKEPLWLCKICAETRETWKKSGAWFYKDLPKYILPGRKNEQQAKYACAVNKGPTEQGANSPVCSYNAWLQSKGRNSSDKEYTDSSDDEIRSGKLSRRPTKKMLSDSESNESPIPTPDVQPPTPKPVQNVPSPAYVLTYTSTGCTVAKEVSDDVSKVVPVPYQRDQEPEIFRSPSKSSAEFVSSNVESSWYKPRKGVEDAEACTPPKPSFKGHVRRDSMSSTTSYCNGRTRAHHRVVQQLPISHSVSQDKNTRLGSAASCEDISPERSSKKLKKKFWRKFRKP